jgi:glycine dehydrogenase
MRGRRRRGKTCAPPSPGRAGSNSQAKLEHHDAFIERHIGPNDAEIAAMLRVVGHDSLDGADRRHRAGSDQVDRAAGPARQPTEVEALAKIRAIASKNQVFRSFIGQGYHGTHTPNVILRNILENPAWYTAYTPYQAEISQGRMEALINFQTMVRRPHRHGDRQRLAARRSHRRRRGDDPGQAPAKSKSNTFLVAATAIRRPRGGAHPRRAAGLTVEVMRRPTPSTELAAHEVFGVLLQYPASTGGWIADRDRRCRAIHAHNALFVVATDLLALTLLKPPGEMGADIVIGNTQRFGVPFGFGGPHAAFMACRDAYKRSMPGRLIGVSIDSRRQARLPPGDADPRAAHPPREGHLQHLHRAGAAGGDGQHVRLYHGPDGLTRIARRVASPDRDPGRRPARARPRDVHATAFDTLCIDRATPPRSPNAPRRIAPSTCA